MDHFGLNIKNFDWHLFEFHDHKSLTMQGNDVTANLQIRICEFSTLFVCNGVLRQLAAAKNRMKRGSHNNFPYLVPINKSQ